VPVRGLVLIQAGFARATGDIDLLIGRPESGRARLAEMRDPARIELDAVYQEGVFRPVVSPALPDGAHVHLVIETPPSVDTDPLQLVGLVYDGLTPAEVAEIETIAFDRSRFLGR
jgi:predicted DNA-binding antitoxin AbrB/MazE fold protein